MSKRDRTPAENEDRAAIAPKSGRFAVSDGASTSARPEVWSEILVAAFAHEGVDPLAALPRLRELWRARVTRPGLPWWGLAKLATGAAATFIGLTVHDTGYHVQAIGDSCLFHLRGQEMLFVGPLAHAEQFSRFPVLVDTVSDKNTIASALWEGGGSYETGDVFVLATDAVAKHILQVYESEGRLLLLSEHTRSQVDFDDFVANARKNGMDNDDTTVCVVRT